MVTGNIYDMMKEVISVENSSHFSLHGGIYPSIAFSEVSFS